jgi:hypothetical protein
MQHVSKHAHKNDLERLALDDALKAAKNEGNQETVESPDVQQLVWPDRLVVREMCLREHQLLLLLLLQQQGAGGLTRSPAAAPCCPPPPA